MSCTHKATKSYTAALERNGMQKVIERKLQLLGHICRMTDDQKLMTLIFDKTDDGNNDASDTVSG